MFRRLLGRQRDRRLNRAPSAFPAFHVASRFPGAAFRAVEQFEARRLLTMPAAPLIPLDEAGFGSVSGEISEPGETDIFRYEAPADGVIQIDQFAADSSLDSLLEVQDENCDFLDENDDGPFGLDSQLILEVTSGQILHFVAGAFSDSTGAFGLTVTPLNDDFGNSIVTAGFLELDDEGFGSTPGEFEADFDTDFVQIVSPLNGTLTVRQEATDDFVDSFLTVLNESGDFIDSNDDSGGSLDSQVTVNVAKGDVLYIQAEEVFGDPGTYQLLVSGDFGDDDATATMVDLVGDSALVFGGTQGLDDLDVFSFVAPEDGTALFELGEVDGEFDAFLSIRDESGTTIAENDDADGSTFDSRIDVNVVAGDLLFVEASDLFGLPGSYSLDVQFLAQPLETLTLNAAAGITRTGSINPAFEEDLYQLDVAADGQLVIDLTGIDDILDPKLQVLDADGTELFENDDFGDSLNSRLEFPVFAGEQFRVVAAGFSDNTGPYELQFRLDVAVADDFPNSVFDAAPLLLDGEGSASTTGSIETAFDIDVFAVPISEDGLLTIQQTSVDDILDPFLVVLDDEGIERFSNDDFGSSLNSRLDVIVQAGETVLIEAGAFSDSSGEYQLDLNLNDDFAGLPEDDFPDSAADATPLDLAPDGTGALNGVIEQAFDSDFVSVTATQTGVLTIRQQSPDGILDPLLIIRDTDGSELARNDDSGGTLDSEVSVSVTAGETVVIEAGAFSDSVGSYVLSVISGDPIVDDFGNNNASAAALSLDPQGTLQQFGNIEIFGDRDVYSIPFSTDGLVSVAVTADDDAFLDPLVRIRNSAGDEIASDDDGGIGLNSLARVSVSAGDVLFIDVGTFSDASTGTYSLDVVLDAGVVITDDFGDSIDDATAGSPQNLTLAAVGVSQAGSIELPGDVDVFRIDIDPGVAENSALRIRQTASGVSTFGFTLDTLVRVFNSDGEEIASNDDDGLSLNSEVAILVSGGDTIFVQAGAFSQSSGDYDLDLSLISDDFSDTIEQSAANPLLQTTLSGSIERSGDIDVFQLDPTLSGRIEIRQRGIGGDPADSLLQIFRQTGNDGPIEFVTLNDDSEGSLDSRVLIDVKASETYFVFASAFGLTTGDYELQVTSLTADDVGDTFASGELLDFAGSDSATRAAEINFAGDVDVFEFTSGQDGSATVQVAANGSSFAGSVSVFRTDGDAFVRIASEVGDGSGSDLLDVFDLTAGTEYFIAVDGLGSIGTYELSVTLSNQALPTDGKIPQEVFESVDERLRELFASGADFEALVDGAVDEFLAAMGGDLGDGEFFVFIADPVDFVLADSQSRRVGFTADQGRVNEVQGARLSRDAPVEVLILPTSDRQFPVQLQGVGSNYQVGGRIVTQAGAINGRLVNSSGETSTGAGTLSKDDGNVALVFDFTDQQNNQFPQNVAQTSSSSQVLTTATDANTTQFQVAPGDEVAVAGDAVRAMQDLRDAYDGRDSADEARRDFLRWLIESLQQSDQPALQTLAGTLEDFAEMFPNAGDDTDDRADSITTKDVFWGLFGGGVMNHLWELGEEIIEYSPDTDSESDSPDDNVRAPAENTDVESPSDAAEEPTDADPKEPQPGDADSVPTSDGQQNAATDQPRVPLPDAELILRLLAEARAAQ